MNDTEVLEICRKIINSDLTAENLVALSDAVKFARGQTGRKTKRSLRPGTVVKFTSNKNGRVYEGTVEKVKVKYVLVNTNFGMYNVPASMLEVA